MTNRINFILPLALILSMPAIKSGAQENPANLTPGFKGNAVYYHLPKTGITVTVYATETVYTPGELARYAERYLGLTNISDHETTLWSIQNVDIETTGVVDRSILYSLEPGRRSKNVIRLTPDGLLQSVNQVASANQTVGVNLSLADFEDVEDAQQTNDPTSFLTQEILQAGSTAKKAELVAQEIFAIRESRNLITRGEADYIPSDGQSLIYVLQQLDLQEKVLTEMFAGTTTVNSHSYTLEFTPDSTAKAHILARFSTRLGLLPSDNLAGEPLWIDVVNANTIAQPAIAESNSILTAMKLDKIQEPKAYLFYNVPGDALISIYNNRQTLASASKPMAQFGYRTAIPRAWFKNGRTPTITFDPATGAIDTLIE